MAREALTERVRRNAVKAALLFALLLPGVVTAPARAQGGDGEEEIPRGELSEIRDRRRALLVVSRSLSVDTRGPLRAVVNEVFGNERTLPRHDYAYDLVSKKIEKYAREYRGLFGEAPSATFGRAAGRVDDVESREGGVACVAR